MFFIKFEAVNISGGLILLEIHAKHGNTKKENKRRKVPKTGEHRLTRNFQNWFFSFLTEKIPWLGRDFLVRFHQGKMNVKKKTDHKVVRLFLQTIRF